MMLRRDQKDGVCVYSRECQSESQQEENHRYNLRECVPERTKKTEEKANRERKIGRK